MAVELDLMLAGEPMRALGDRALYWPARRRLLIADLHLGKGDIFRRAGIALPSGGTHHDLARLAALVEHTGAHELWVLGDVLHGPAPQASWRGHVDRWRRQHHHLRVIALAGNHDRDLDAAADLGFEVFPDSVEDGPFVLRHHPQPDPQRHVLCGHLHPVFKAPGTTVRWPAFLLRQEMTVLPAFSQFTAGVVPDLAPGERLIACVEGQAIALPPA
ncbi:MULTISPECIES: ligase-associated DNA damage response endonuclease PdeM [Pseudoxanthomonas]|jgi:DNA ligase-associated metallophosphoesterase|uniref:DNA ligase-associated metallophosphoesterase n=1 Tax=Pseudoxanthomonas winnipegensis TaxID=2480810 RepID=A0A4Q8LI57_9GAMM|nr:MULTISPECIES: ligase-associated DNA damage response endonuclease PdeM [Pseudoxanthomonas]MDQ1118741.1 DNA ligase-associated metallophosphoesterase [Pseudoxanthomonas winnipegensis]MDQ1131925.1 DNA ligase-associated metallophosphoesterase [Pseudoxanthomonas winnipegensis]MDR6138058.1 DNA ligase-associated metallophosphoesterase [Pseudoxanthomonas sp. SORGH_AS_0997]RZZ87481.1 ligase-associated DNA damage response endonuclease PdeM [Pseudoxanthomonas winnipegensis]TAA07916.1 ligase-associated 